MTINTNNSKLCGARRTMQSFVVIGVAILHTSLPGFVNIGPNAGVVIADELVSDDRVPASTDQAYNGHRHDPIVVRSKPVIERLPVSVIDPVDVAVSRGGAIYVADAKAQTVFRVASDGLVDTPIRDANGLTRICLDQDSHLYVLQRESKNSRVLQVTPNGLSVELAVVPFEASSMARLASGEILLASDKSPHLMMISTDATQTTLATLPETIVDISVSSSEQIHVLHGSGLVTYVSLDGSTSVSGRVPAKSRRLFSLPEGEMAALTNSATAKSEIILVERETDVNASDETGTADEPADAKIGPRVYSTVPAGTQAVAFDDLGNMSLVNPELRAVTRVTSTMMVPCPHCGRPTKLILSPNGPAAPRSRSF